LDDAVSTEKPTAPPTAVAAAAAPEPTPEDRARARIFRLYLTCGVSTALLFASFHPIDAGMLAWIALVPLLVVCIRETRRAAFALAYFTTMLYHLVGLAWIALCAPPGWLVTTFLEGFYGIAAIAFARFARRKRIPLTLALPPFWVVTELVRGSLFPFIRFPWLLLGHTQHARTTLIQLLDITSVYGLTFLVVLVNAFVADVVLFLLDARDRGEQPSPADARRFALLGLFPTLAIAAALVYGVVRPPQVERALEPGPRVLAVQVDLPQSVKDAEDRTEKVANDNLRLTREAWATARRDEKPDVIVWSETMWPWPLNTERPDERTFVESVVKLLDRRKPGYGQMVLRKDRELFAIARDTGAHMIVGAVDRGPLRDFGLHPIERVDADALLKKLMKEGILDENDAESIRRRFGAGATSWDVIAAFFDGAPENAAMRRRITNVALDLNPLPPEHNSVFHITSDGRVAERYDKTNLVPASEFIPGKDSTVFRWFYDLVKTFVPPEFVTFEPGRGPVLMRVRSRDGQEWPMAPDLCFEVSFPELLRESVRQGALVHVCPSNDAWFERSAEIDLAYDQSIYRAIEGRRAVVRCVNRGMTMLVDPLGRTKIAYGQDAQQGRSAMHVEATINENATTTRLETIYVRVGDLFAWLCVVASFIIIIIGWRRPSVAKAVAV
jgi:apolipoprotein N-acyltransferase